MYSHLSFCLTILLVIVVNTLYHETEATQIMVMGPSPRESDKIVKNLEFPSKMQQSPMTKKNLSLGPHFNGGLCLKSEHKTRHKNHKNHPNENHDNQNHHNRRKRKSQCSCRRILCPVCSSDGVSYNNMCQFNCSKSRAKGSTIAHNGRCPSNKNQQKKIHAEVSLTHTNVERV